MATCVIQADPQTRNETKAGFLIMKYTFLGEDHGVFYYFFYYGIENISVFSTQAHFKRIKKRKLLICKGLFWQLIMGS